ncbi:hypothetical protein DCS_03288 [Drechmeria coniospora]|uniref:Uncharacterized protein n=1 Tax=Drechmeria coniospora TaxID=98403 RepID=A0A151GYH6_DRECN|nr:hypothetical protein DCS_03288 [Drechmeria coniospora]KYK62141.1 hypothetical protein DCS_03288 [Drechmeria coniospora]
MQVPIRSTTKYGVLNKSSSMRAAEPLLGLQVDKQVQPKLSRTFSHSSQPYSSFFPNNCHLPPDSVFLLPLPIKSGRLLFYGSLHQSHIIVLPIDIANLVNNLGGCDDGEIDDDGLPEQGGQQRLSHRHIGRPMLNDPVPWPGLQPYGLGHGGTNGSGTHGSGTHGSGTHGSGKHGSGTIGRVSAVEVASAAGYACTLTSAIRPTIFGVTRGSCSTVELWIALNDTKSTLAVTEGS